MKRMAIYDRATRRVLSVIGGTRHSLERTVAALPDGRAALPVPRGIDPVGCIVVEGAFQPAPPCQKLAEKKLRIARNERLARDVDLPAMRLAALSQAQATQLAAYRQALLDLTKGDPFAPDWPKRPDFI